jgi:hypothetical protein
VSRLTYPKAGEPRPAALPPGERTVGQLVAESISFYSDNFRRAILLGIAPAALSVVTTSASRNVSSVLLATLGGALLSAAYVGASVLVLDRRPPKERLVVAWAMGWLIFLPVPLLVLLFVLPGAAWLAAFGLVVPVLVAEDLAPLAALRRAWRLARADYLHALGSIATLAILVILTQGVLAFLLRGAGDLALSTASAVAAVVMSPLLLIGAAMLYVDQSARADDDAAA